MFRSEVMIFFEVNEQKMRSIGDLATEVLMTVEDVPECTRETLCTGSVVTMRMMIED